MWRGLFNDSCRNLSVRVFLEHSVRLSLTDSPPSSLLTEGDGQSQTVVNVHLRRTNSVHSKLYRYYYYLQFSLFLSLSLSLWLLLCPPSWSCLTDWVRCLGQGSSSFDDSRKFRYPIPHPEVRVHTYVHYLHVAYAHVRQRSSLSQRERERERHPLMSSPYC